MGKDYYIEISTGKNVYKERFNYTKFVDAVEKYLRPIYYNINTYRTPFCQEINLSEDDTLKIKVGKE